MSKVLIKDEGIKAAMIDTISEAVNYAFKYSFDNYDDFRRPFIDKIINLWGSKGYEIIETYLEERFLADCKELI